MVPMMNLSIYVRMGTFKLCCARWKAQKVSQHLLQRFGIASQELQKLRLQKNVSCDLDHRSDIPLVSPLQIELCRAGQCS